MAGFCAVAAIVLAASADASREIPLVREGGVYEVPVIINGWLERPFILDSGASDVQVSADVFLTLYPRGGPAPRFLPGVSYRLADGRVVSSRRFVIPSLRIGDYEFPDAAASIGESGSPLLLGQNVLTRLGTWSIDNRRGVLVLEESAAGAPATGCLSWRTAPPPPVRSPQRGTTSATGPRRTTSRASCSSPALAIGRPCSSTSSASTTAASRRDCAGPSGCVAPGTGGASTARPRCARSAAAPAACPDGFVRWRGHAACEGFTGLFATVQND